MRWLHKQNMNLTITGPGHNGRCFPKDVQFADKPLQAVQGADALIIVTEWKGLPQSELGGAEGCHEGTGDF